MTGLPVLRDGRLRADPGGRGQIMIDTPQWRAWLASATGFAVAHPAGAFTVRRERSGSGRGAGYWRAYRRIGGERRRVYLGRTEHVTAAALAAAAVALAQPAAARVGSPDPAPVPVATKLRVPPVRNRALPRPALATRLAQASQLPVTLVCAPAGYGKTTALAAWCATRGRVGWLSIEDDDNDPASFCRLVSAALSLPADQGDPSAPPDPRRWAARVVNTLAAAPGIVTLVLDDYHRIVHGAIHESLEYLVAHLPDQVRLVIAARRPPPLPLARWRAPGRMADVDTSDLRLASEETSAFLADVIGVRLPGPLAAELHTRTEGWLAGVQLAGLALRRGVPPRRALAAAGGDLDAYLLTEVLDTLPPATRELLLRTSVLSRLTGGLCEAVAGRADRSRAGDAGAGSLAELVAQDLFLVPLDDTRTWYRYHHLFAAAVAAYAQREHPVLVRDSHRRAATWHEQHGDPREAVRHAIAAGEPEYAGRLVAALAQRDGGLWTQHQLVARWLAALPEPVLAGDPVLRLLTAWIATRTAAVGEEPHLAGLAERAGSWLERAGPAGLPTRLRGIYYALITFRQVLAGPWEAVIQSATAALDQLGAEQTSLRVETAGRLLDPYRHGCAAGDGERAERELASLSRPPHDPSRRLDALLGVATWHLLRGELGRVVTTCDQGARLAEELQLDAGEYRAAAQILRAAAMLEWNRLADAERLLASDRAAALNHSDPGIRLHQQWSTAELSAARGNEPDVRRTLDEVDEYVASLPGFATPGIGAVTRRYTCARRAHAYLMLGDAAAARCYLERGRGIVPNGLPLGPALYEAVVVSWLAFAERNPAAAAASAQAAIRRFRDTIGAACQIRLRVIAALAEQDRGEREHAAASLAEAVAIAAPGGFLRPFMEHGEHLVDLLAHLARRGRPQVPVRHLDRVRRACAAPADPPAAPRLTAREREVLSLLADGLSAPQAARRLGLAPATVRSHVERLAARLDARTQAQAVSRAYQLGLLPAGDSGRPEHPPVRLGQLPEADPSAVT